MTAGPLIPAAELATRLADVTVLDVRYAMAPQQEQYAEGHLPGAVYVDLDTVLADPPGGGRGRHPLPDPSLFGSAMRTAGVSSGRPVVVYDDWEGRAAARAWWLLRFHGHPDVRFLDGGWSGWVAAGGAVSALAVTPDPGDFVPSGGGGMTVVDASTVLDVDVLVDARAGERFRGEIEPIDPVAGHLPGAANVPTTDNLDAAGFFRTAEELRAAYDGVGARAGASVAAYCGSGVTAAHAVLAMEVAGVAAALYPGSWSEWVSDPDRPVELGPTSAHP